MNKLDLNIVREYDIRGIYGKNLFAENGYNIGKGLGTKAIEKGTPIINLGYDGRFSSPELSSNLIQGILDSGCDVNNIGLVPSPLLYFSNFHLNVDYGIVVTASHNPKEYNGFKIVSQKERFYGADLKTFAEFVNAGEFASGKGTEHKIDLSEPYLSGLLDLVKDYDLSNLKIAFDPACGAGGEITKILTDRLSSKTFLINEKIDGDFPAHDPDPTIEKNLEQLKTLVTKNYCDLGIALDGDADRVGVIDDEGAVIWGDQLVTLFAKDQIENNKTSKKLTIIADVKASKVFSDKVKEFGGTPLIWRTGHSLIKAKMKETGAALAGEMSGHVFFKENNGYDDGIYAAMKLIQIIAKTGIKLSDFRKSLPKTFSTNEEKISCPDDKKFIAIDSIKAKLRTENIAFIDIDGVRVESEKGWWLIRASNTSPNLTTRCEAYQEQDLEPLKTQLSTNLQSCL
jgi:phosphomannomutase